MKKRTLIKKLQYKFDTLMSKSTIAPLTLLFLTSALVIVFLSILLLAFRAFPTEHIAGLQKDHNVGFLDALWVTILRMLDPGVISNDPIDPIYIALMIAATISGLLMVSILISIINSGVTRKMFELRKGKSAVIEKNHTVILGWSFQVFPIISELIVANENIKNAVIAILAEKDTIEMLDEIKQKIGDTKNTKVVCRTGNPIDIHDLEIINLHEAKSIIIIAPESKDPDSNVIKTILAITNNPNRKPLPAKYHIVAEIRDPRNIKIALIAGRDEVQLVVFDYLISRITAQTCRQPGLSVVFTELLDFSGDEIYFHEEPRLVGKTFVEALFAYENSCVVGIRKKDHRIMLKPPLDMKIEAGDRIIAISEDDDTVMLSGKVDYHIDPGAIRKAQATNEFKPENTLIIGWNRRAPLIINELDNYVAAGSKITVLTDNKYAEKELMDKCSGLVNQSVSFWYGDTTNRKILDELNIRLYQHIIVLSQTDLADVQSTDARTLNTLLHLRDIADKDGYHFSIVSEMLDDRNRELAEITHTDDFIVSVKLDSLLLSQISENKELKIIFEDLFSAGGPSIYIRPAEHYIELGRPVNFYTVMESARQQNQIAIGYKLSKAKKRYEGQGLSYGVMVNPVKSNQIFFSQGDKIIVLADDENFNGIVLKEEEYDYQED